MQQRMIFVLVAVALTTALATFSGCGKDDKAKADGSEDSGGASISTGRYQFVFNGCDTGEHHYKSHDQHCRMLLDDELNHHCARTLREAEYQQRCTMQRTDGAAGGMPGIDDPAAVSGWSQGPDGNPVVNGNQEPARPKKAYAVTAAEASSQPSLPPLGQFPKELTVLGKLVPDAKLKTSETDGSVITTLEGSFKVSVETSYRIELSLANKVLFVGLPPQCVSVSNFTSIQAGVTTVQFTLAGIDSKTNVSDPSSCASILQRFARGGFQARFTGAYLVTAAAGIGQSMVNLSVMP